MPAISATFAATAPPIDIGTSPLALAAFAAMPTTSDSGTLT
jgi:hypothetical protein